MVEWEEGESGEEWTGEYRKRRSGKRVSRKRSEKRVKRRKRGSGRKESRK